MRIKKNQIKYVHDYNKRKSKRTSIGNSSNSFGAGRNKRSDRKRYRGQGK